jgi:hypothetical protein
VAVSFIGGGNRSTQRKPPTCRKSLTTLSYNVLSSTPRQVLLFENIDLKEAVENIELSNDNTLCRKRFINYLMKSKANGLQNKF